MKETTKIAFSPSEWKKYFRKFGYLVVLAACRAGKPIGHRIDGLKRRITFDLSPPGTLLISAGEMEKFVVLAGDRYIGRGTYVDRRPYDFPKLERVLTILPERRWKCLIDVGANIGTICIPAVRQGFFSEAIAIEPEPTNYSLLLANSAINMVANRISCQNIALGVEEHGSLLFEMSAENYGDHRIHVSSELDLFGENTRRIIEVPSKTLDAAVGPIDPVTTLIWMDTQGYEGHVLRGAKEILSKGTPLVSEFWPYGLRRSGGYEYFLDSLMAGKYSFFYDLNQPRPSRKLLSSAALQEIHDRLGIGHSATDLLFV